MATLMEKDVALEVIASTLALVSRKIQGHRGELGLPPVEKKLVGIRNELYNTPHEQVDFDDVIATCKSIKQEYEALEDGAIIWSGDAS